MSSFVVKKVKDFDLDHGCEIYELQEYLFLLIKLLLRANLSKVKFIWELFCTLDVGFSLFKKPRRAFPWDNNGCCCCCWCHFVQKAKLNFINFVLNKFAMFWYTLNSIWNENAFIYYLNILLESKCLLNKKWA